MEKNAEHGEGKQRKRHQGRRRIRNTQTINQKNRTCCDKNLCFFWDKNQSFSMFLIKKLKPVYIK